MRDVLHLRLFLNFAAPLGLLVLVCAGPAVQGAGAEDFLVQVWDTDAGLPQSSVTSIAQTPDGYLWVGTLHGGLARFDGERFVNFHPGNTPELQSIEIEKLLVDAQGTLWVGTVEGALISYRDGRFRFERQSRETPGAWLNEIVSATPDSVVLSSVYGWLFEGRREHGTNDWTTLERQDGDANCSPCRDRHGTIWDRALDGGLVQFRTNAFVRVPEPPGLRSPQINALLTGADGELWVGTAKELARWEGGKFVNMTPTNGETELAVQQMAACPDGSLWVLTDQGLRKCRERQWVAQVTKWDGNAPQPSIRHLQLKADAQGGLWVLHYGDGVWHVDAGGQVSRVGEAQGLPNAMVQCCFEDREGNVWLGLDGSGLACVRARTFHTLWPGTAPPNLIPRSVCQDQAGAMWFGTSENSLLRWQQGEFTTFMPPTDWAPGIYGTVFPGAAGELWAGNVGNGVFTLEAGRFARPFPATDIGTVARVLYEDRRGRLWIGSEFGLFCWDKKTLKHFTATDGFPAAYVLAITEDATGNVWIGTALGELWKYREGKFTSYRPQDTAIGAEAFAAAAAAEPLKDRNRGALTGGERFWALHADSEGVIWIGTLGGGLLRFQNGTFTRYTTRDGLPNEHVNQILEDERGQLWLGTQSGIVRVSKLALNRFASGAQDKPRFIAYGRQDGLPTVECPGSVQPAAWRTRDGRLWFTTSKGAVWVDPNEVRANLLPPLVVIEEVAIDGKRVAEDGQPEKSPAVQVPSRLTVPPGRHYLNFKFTAPSLTDSDRVRFKWRLVGLEKDWGPESSQRLATYSFVPPGEYEFRVKACNRDGVWNEAGTPLRVTVQPYFWQTHWFFWAATLALVAGTAGAVTLALRTRHRRRLARLEVLRVTEQERSRIARDLHDELGSGLTEVTMLTAPFAGVELSPEGLRKRLQRVGDRAHGLVEALDEIVWAVDPAKDNLPALAKYFAGYVEEYLKDSPIACQVQMPVTFPERPVKAPVRHQLFLAVREAVTNAVRHAQPGRIGFAMELAADGQLQITITDDGRGFDPATIKAGNGLANLRTRLASVGGHCELRSRPGGGTTVRLTVTLADEPQNL